VVDSIQKLIIPAGTKIFLNYKAGLWVYQYGQIQVLGQKGNEVIFTGARREKDFADEPGQWDRIWINEGSNDNIIDYAIIKNGYIGLQTELLGSAGVTITPTFPARRLKLTNTKIQNMSLWGLYSLAYNIYGGNNVISNCQDRSLNILLGGRYTFLHCTFANYWDKEKTRTKPAVFINNYTESNLFPMDSAYFGNCIVDGKLTNEYELDLQSSGTYTPSVLFSSCWLKTDKDVVTDANRYLNCRKGSGNLNYDDKSIYNFNVTNEALVKGYFGTKPAADVAKFTNDILLSARNSNSITAGAYK
jgi:hypothetical protein